jgi:TonB family protein
MHMMANIQAAALGILKLHNSAHWLHDAGDQAFQASARAMVTRQLCYSCCNLPFAEAGMYRLFSLATALLISTLPGTLLQAQTSPSPQTARQALIEMFFGSAANHLEKHLPDATRRSFQKLDSGDGRSFLSEFSMLASQAKAGGAKLETFDTGPTLLTVEEQQQGRDRVEITVERDDLVGDEDQIEVALHMTRAGKEQTLPFVPHLIFVMKTESEIWRLNEISVTVRVPLADPDFLKNIEDRQRGQHEQMTIWSLRMVTTSEKAYNAARGSYACTLSALGTADKSGPENHPFLFDRELVTGKKGGYIYAITGCDASHYKVVAEPALPDSGQRSFCSDESGAVRAAVDGKASTCLTRGETVKENGAGDIAIGLQAANPTAAAPAEGQSAQKPLRVRVSQGVSQALVVSKTQPIYPKEAKLARIQGSVVLKTLISRTGDVVSLDVESGHPLLTQAAEDAVKQWKYKPYLLNGNPVEVETKVTIDFELRGN